MWRRVQALTRTHELDILATEARRAERDTRVRLEAMPSEPAKGIAEPVVTYAVRGSTRGLEPGASGEGLRKGQHDERRTAGT